MSKPNDGTPFTPAPGVSGLRFPWGYELTGTADALIATRMVDEEWLAKLPKRVVHFEAGYRGGWSERKRGGLLLVHVCERDWIREPGEYDGAARASWADGPWRPTKKRKRAVATPSTNGDSFNLLRVKTSLIALVEAQEKATGEPAREFWGAIGAIAQSALDVIEGLHAEIRKRTT